MYQPVFRVNGGAPIIEGVECLSRGPKGTNFESAAVLFEYVRLKREESLVEPRPHRRRIPRRVVPPRLAPPRRQQLRELGTAIALDDIGLGQSNFKMLLDVRPQFLKLDSYLVDGCTSDPHRRPTERYGVRRP